MAHNDYESSAARGRPVELYEFVYGTDALSQPLAYRYTSAEQAVELSGNTYAPLPIDRTKIETKGRPDSAIMEISVPRTSEIAELFRIFPPSRVVNVIIRQGHLPNPDDPVEFALGEQFPVVYTGRVLETSRAEGTRKLACQSLSAGMKRPGLRRFYQWPCPLVLYGPRCMANKVAATRACTVVSAVGNRLTVDPAGYGANAAVDFVGGLIEWQGASGLEIRGILRADAAGLIVATGPVSSLAPDDTVDLILGCPHTLAGCETLHQNVVNYGGQPWIPTYNPVNKNNHT